MIELHEPVLDRLDQHLLELYNRIFAMITSDR